MKAPATAEQEIRVEPGEPTTSQSSSSRWLGLAISIVSLAGVVWWARGQSRPHFPTSAHGLALVSLAITVYVPVTVIRGWRWHRILKQAGIAHRAADPYFIAVIGYMGNTVLPARGGEILRVVLMAGRSTANRREVIGSIIAERLLDASTLVLLFVALAWSGFSAAGFGRLPAAIAAAGLAAAVGLLAVYLRLRRAGRLDRFATLARPFARASRLLLGRVGALLFASTIGVWFLETLVFWLVARSLSLDVTFFEGMFLVVVTSIVISIPAGPAYVGTFDATLLLGLHAFDLRGAQTLAFTLLWRFVIFVPITIAGVVLLVARYGGLRWARRIAPA